MCCSVMYLNLSKAAFIATDSTTPRQKAASPANGYIQNKTMRVAQVDAPRYLLHSASC